MILENLPYLSKDIKDGDWGGEVLVEGITKTCQKQVCVFGNVLATVLIFVTK